MASSLRRRAARLFALIVICVICVDSMPYHRSLQGVKKGLSAVLNRVGLWQGGWSMFAPNPVINNGWYSAEIRSRSGEVTNWDSPIWGRTSGWEKFINFRHMNYYNRLSASWNTAALYDLADYLARRRSLAASITLYRNQLRINMPDDGSLATREEIEWLFTTESIVNKNYEP